MGENTVEMVLRGAALNEFATKLANRLLEEGFIVHRYDAYSTNSIYLKLDYGVCNSIRISDHVGKGYLKYRYNIGTDVKKTETKQDKFPRHYYPIQECDAMVEKILEDRASKQKRYGKTKYEIYMAENKKTHANDKGFWSKSRRVF